MVVEAAFPAFLEQDLPLATSRHRMHSGYAGQASRGMYYSASVTKDGGTMAATGQPGSQKPMAILANSGTRCLAPLLGGLQAAGMALLVQDGEDALGASGETYTMELAGGLAVQLRVGEVVAPDGTVGLLPDLSVPRPAAGAGEGDPALDAALAALRAAQRPRRAPPVHPGAYLPARREQPYAEMIYPAREYRLLALFRFWAAIHYFFPYKHLLDYSWDEVLREFVPKLEAAGDALGYALALAELVTRIQDGHGRLMGSAALDAYLGTHAPPIWLTSVEGATVVTHIFEDEVRQASGLRVGDVLLAVDGEEIAARRQRLAGVCAASTPQGLRWRVDRLVVGGPLGGATVLTVRDAAGRIRAVHLTCTVTREQLRALWAAHGREQLPVFGILAQNLGYMDLERLAMVQVDEAFEALKGTAGIIFDIRGYPHGTAWAIAPRLASRPVTTARFRWPERHGPDPGWWSVRHFAQTARPGGPWRYAGRVAVLIDENAVSHAEHSCLFLEAATAVTFVGSPTMGANGDVTAIDLLGGLTARFTGADVRHADGRQLQRVGIQPHIPVEPTLEGIRQGRDEVLEAAIAALTSTPNRAGT